MSCRTDLPLLTVYCSEHVHSSNEVYADQFAELKIRLGIDSIFGG